MTHKSKKRKRARRVELRKWHAMRNTARQRVIARFQIGPSIVVRVFDDAELELLRQIQPTWL